MHKWEVGAGQNIADWMEYTMGECDHLIGVYSPDYINAPYSRSERLAAFFLDGPIAREGIFLPVIVRP